VADKAEKGKTSAGLGQKANGQAKDNVAAADKSRPKMVSQFTDYNTLASRSQDRTSAPKLFAGQVIKSADNIAGSGGQAVDYALLTQYVLISILGLVVAALAVNILVRREVQHKPIILESMVFILFIAGLVAARLHFLESGLPNILIM